MKTVSLIGAPTDVGASVRGAGMGPDALRVVPVTLSQIIPDDRTHQLIIIASTPTFRRIQDVLEDAVSSRRQQGLRQDRRRALVHRGCAHLHR